MRPTSSLGALWDSAERRLSFLRGLADTLSVPPTHADDRLAAFLAIEALNVWASFSRAFYLSCVFNAYRVQGGRVALGQNQHIKTKAAAIDFAIRTLRTNYTRKRKAPWQRRDEPAWHDESSLVKLSQGLALSNWPQVQASFGVQTTVFKELPTLRNFFAHRNEDTARKVRNIITGNYPGLGFTSRTKPVEFLSTRLPGRPQNVLADWIDDLRAITSLLPL